MKLIVSEQDGLWCSCSSRSREHATGSAGSALVCGAEKTRPVSDKGSNSRQGGSGVEMKLMGWGESQFHLHTSAVRNQSLCNFV